METYALDDDSASGVAARRIASEIAMATKHKEEMDKNALAHSFTQAKFAMRLQSQYRGFVARKVVWLTRHGGRPLDIKDMSVGLGRTSLSTSLSTISMFLF